MQLGTDAELSILRDSLIAGVLAGIAYDAFRILRRALRHPAFTYVLDFAYALLFGAAFFIFSLGETNYYRGFILAGMTAGAVMWCIAPGRLLTGAVCRILSALVRRITILLSKSAVILHKPTVKICHKLVNIRPKSEKRKKILKST